VVSLDTELLMGTVLPGSSGGAQRLWRDHAAQIVDWAPLIQRSIDHGTTSLLCNQLIQLGPANVPAEILAAAEIHLQERRRANAAAVQQLLEILSGLKAAGISALPFKGPTLISAYGDIALRSFRDLDILVHEVDFQATLQVLERMGYTLPTRQLAPQHLDAYHRRVRQDALFPDVGLTVEPHFGLAQVSFGLDLPAAGLLQRSQPRELAGSIVSQMSPEDTFLTLALHGSKERWKRLIWLADVIHFVQVTPGLDWGMVRARAAENGLTRAVNLAVLLTTDVSSDVIPREIVSAAQGDPVAVRLRQVVLQSLEQSATTARREWLEVKQFHWKLLVSRRDRLRFLSGLVSDIRLEDYEAANLSPRLSWAFPAVKAWRRISGQAARDRSLN
jgi:hypothetical protein